ncbi:hypothetical protein [Nonomuraea sp. NPDC049750]|uniref:hypothetical protein n=1 Tax=Nonomuraea sp. NPDC049750 TaxID=3154738 RepID=UPI0033CB995E
MTDLGDLDDPYHGVHPAVPQAGYERLTWQEPDPRCDRVRVRDHTCECQHIVYELCQAGGLHFIRRLYRSDCVVEHQSDWLRAPEAERLWLRILLGQAR